jgi:hypothetical protein
MKVLLLLLFDSILYIIYFKLYVICYIQYISYSAQYIIYSILNSTTMFSIVFKYNANVLFKNNE